MTREEQRLTRAEYRSYCRRLTMAGLRHTATLANVLGAIARTELARRIAAQYKLIGGRAA
jgi:hypothetical protein